MLKFPANMVLVFGSVSHKAHTALPSFLNLALYFWSYETWQIIILRYLLIIVCI